MRSSFSSVQPRVQRITKQHTKQSKPTAATCSNDLQHPIVSIHFPLSRTRVQYNSARKSTLRHHRHNNIGIGIGHPHRGSRRTLRSFCYLHNEMDDEEMNPPEAEAAAAAKPAEAAANDMSMHRLARYYAILRDFMSYFHSTSDIYPPSHEVSGSAHHILYFVASVGCDELTSNICSSSFSSSSSLYLHILCHLCLPIHHSSSPEKN